MQQILIELESTSLYDIYETKLYDQLGDLFSSDNSHENDIKS